VTTIHTQWLGNKIIIPKEEFEQLIEIAKKREEIELQTTELVESGKIIDLLGKSGSFDFWKQEGEDIYSIEDGEAI
jgi:hypothetical protein